LITVAKPQDIVIVQVPADWTPNQVKDEQNRLSDVIQRERIGIKVLVVPGGAISWQQPMKTG
jgi:hypothetical protein